MATPPKKRMLLQSLKALAFPGAAAAAFVASVAGWIRYTDMMAIIGVMLFWSGLRGTRSASPPKILAQVSLPILLLIAAWSLGAPFLLILPAAAATYWAIGVAVGEQRDPRHPQAGLALAVVAAGILVLATYQILPRALEKGFTREEMMGYPEFSLTSLAGETIRSGDFRGKVVVMDFWASWCGPCLKAMPAVEELQKRYASSPDVLFLAVNTSWRGETRERAIAFLQDRKFSIPVAYDSAARVTTLLGIQSIPTAILLDRTGKVRFRHTGAAAGTAQFVETMSEKVNGLLAEPPSPR